MLKIRVEKLIEAVVVRPFSRNRRNEQLKLKQDHKLSPKPSREPYLPVKELQRKSWKQGMDGSLRVNREAWKTRRQHASLSPMHNRGRLATSSVIDSCWSHRHVTPGDRSCNPVPSNQAPPLRVYIGGQQDDDRWPRVLITIARSRTSTYATVACTVTVQIVTATPDISRPRAPRRPINSFLITPVVWIKRKKGKRNDIIVEFCFFSLFLRRGEIGIG